MSISPRLARLLQASTIVIVAVLLWLFLRDLDWHELSRALRRADPLPLLLSTLLYFACLFGKALSWKIMLEPRYVVTMRRLYRYTIAGAAAAALTPARTGELLRVWALKRRHGVPVADATAVAFAEKLLLALTLLIVVAPAPWLLPLPEWVESSILLCGGLAIGALVALVFAVRIVEAHEPRSWFARFIAGMHVVREPKRLALVLATLVLVWVVDLIEVMIVLYAVGISVPVAGAMFILFTFNLAVAIPSTPAQIGTLQIGALVATNLLGIPHGPALAFALLYQLMQIVPLLVVGLILALDLVRGRMPPEPQPAS